MVNWIHSHTQATNFNYNTGGTITINPTYPMTTSYIIHSDSSKEEETDEFAEILGEIWEILYLNKELNSEEKLEMIELLIQAHYHDVEGDNEEGNEYVPW